MTHEQPHVDWSAVATASSDGLLMNMLATLPRASWAERDVHGISLLHYASEDDNEAALVALLSSGLDPTPRDQWLATPAHNAVRDRRPRALELLCAAGADLRARDVGDDSPLDDAFQQLPNHGDDACVRVLMANGVRLSTVSVEYRPNITPQVEAFERGVLRCRAAVVAMLHVKRASGKLPNWDRFLLRTLALDVWTTRHAPHWSQAAPLIVVDSAVRE